MTTVRELERKVLSSELRFRKEISELWDLINARQELNKIEIIHLLKGIRLTCFKGMASNNVHEHVSVRHEIKNQLTEVITRLEKES